MDIFGQKLLEICLIFALWVPVMITLKSVLSKLDQIASQLKKPSWRDAA